MSFTTDKNLPDTIQRLLDSAVRKHITMKPMVQLQTRRVIASADSTVVTLNQSEVVHAGLNANLPYHKMVLRGKEVVGLYDADGNKLGLPVTEERKFSATGNTATISSYTCKEYVSANGKITVWVTDQLPSFINPGVKNVDVPGGILAFKIDNGSNFIYSVAKAIQKE